MAEKSVKPRASLHTLGCRLNQVETSVLGNLLTRRGFEIVPFGESTDLFVLNTCSVTENAEKDCRYAVRKTLRRSPDAFVAVTGCYAQTGSEQLRQVPGIDMVLGNQFKMDLAAYLPTGDKLRKLRQPEVLHARTIDRHDFTLPGTAYSDSTRALLKVQDGCDFMCSFCIIPFARGHERSRVLADIVHEAESLVAQGHKEVVLTGVNIGRYDYEGSNLLDVIRRLDSISGVERIRLSSIEPTTISEDILEYMATSHKVCRYLHVPLQSGDDRILAAMNRKYTIRQYEKLIKKAVALVPDLGLGTDLMVGFPGEGEEEFENTRRFVNAMPFSYFHVFSYSPRPGTAAVRMKHSVPAAMVRHRSRTLAELSRNKSMAYHKRHIGRTVTVLFEKGQRDGLRTGLTDTFMKVAVASDENLSGTLREVTIIGITDGLAYGRLVTSLAPAREVAVL
ncbi:MAG: tRNA (N(6)-L-threonylcarbamoyladenosine(37)-C(2))-methylthiotransferase MtaB [Nitrospiraceae bacterium]